MQVLEYDENCCVGRFVPPVKAIYVLCDDIIHVDNVFVKELAWCSIGWDVWVWCRTDAYWTYFFI